MILYKTFDEIELVRQSSLFVSNTLAEVAKWIKPGVGTTKLDAIATEFIQDRGGIPGFLGYRGFPGALCCSINDEVVHGIPRDEPLKDGDIISLDCGVLKNGFYGDSAYTFAIGEISDDVRMLCEATRISLYKGIEKAKVGNRVGDISFAIQFFAERECGYGIVRELVGHGVGMQLHEEPEVPNYGQRGKGIKLKEGLVIAVEPMVNLGTREVAQDKDGWTIKTQDNLPSAHYEHTIAITKGGPEILSTFDCIDEEVKNNEALTFVEAAVAVEA